METQVTTQAEEIKSSEERAPEQEKPKKRVLTEAQRLAFLKGREKRMLNIQKKKEEKEEAMKIAKEIKTEEIQEPKKEKKTTESVKPTQVNIEDEDDIKAKKIADYVYLKLMKDVENLAPEEQVKPKRTYTRRTKSAPIVKSEPVSLPPEKIISWC